MKNSNCDRQLLHLSIDAIKTPLIATQMTWTEALDEPYRGEITFLIKDARLAIDELLEQRVKLTLSLYDKQSQYFHGIITAIHQQTTERLSYSCYRITVEPEFITLHDCENCQIFQDLTILQIIRKMFTFHHLIDYDDASLERNYPRLDYCIQYQETGFDFISRLLQQHGIHYYFKHEKNKVILHLADSNLLYYRHEKPLIYNQHSNAARVYDWQDIKTLKGSWIKGQSYYLHLAPGHAFSLHDDTDNQDYYITRIVHHASDNSQMTSHKIQQQPSYHNCFEAIPITQTYKPKKSLPHPVIPNVQLATVIGPQADAIHTDGVARIKVMFNWPQAHHYAENNSCWIRTQQAIAGHGWGSLFIPSVGQQVVVDFIDGNPDQPIIVGCLANPEHRSVHEMPKDRYHSSITSRSGNAIQFIDKPNNGLLTLKATRDLSLTVKGDCHLTIAHNNTALIREGNLQQQVKKRYHITAKQSISFTCGSSKLHINNKGIQIEADAIDINS